MECIRECMIKIDGKEIGFNKGDVVTDPKIIEALKGSIFFTDSAPEKPKSTRTRKPK